MRNGEYRATGQNGGVVHLAEMSGSQRKKPQQNAGKDAESSEDEEILEVEKLLSVRRSTDDERIEFLVAWKGYGSEENSWGKYGNLGDDGQAMVPDLKARMGKDYPDKRTSPKSPAKKRKRSKAAASSPSTATGGSSQMEKALNSVRKAAIEEVFSSADALFAASKKLKHAERKKLMQMLMDDLIS